MEKAVIDAGITPYPFSYKIFEDMGHGGLVGENTERFIQEVDKAHKHTGD